jgi:hypothetical protein
MKDKYIFIISCIVLVILVILNNLQCSENFITPLPNVTKINNDFLTDFDFTFKNYGSSETYNLIVNDLYTKPKLVNQINTCYYSISKDEMASCILDIINDNDMKSIIKKNAPVLYTNIINPSIQQQFSQSLINKYFPPLRQTTYKPTNQ